MEQETEEKECQSDDKLLQGVWLRNKVIWGRESLQGKGKHPRKWGGGGTVCDL